MPTDFYGEFEASLIGLQYLITRREYDWLLDSGEFSKIRISCPWRIISMGRIAVTSADDRVTFGQAVPFDSEAAANHLLGSKSITAVELHRQTADLRLHFGEIMRLEVFAYSVGFESWDAGYASDGERRMLIALGGGDISFF
jgi:hypothetical protein